MTAVSSVVLEILERASTLHERLTGAFVPRAPAPHANVDERLSEWRRIAAKGDRKRFQRRLALDDMDVALARSAVGPVCLTAGEAIPDWAHLLERYLERCGDTIPPSGATVPASEVAAEAAIGECDDQVPFGELFVALVDIAEREVATRAGSALPPIAPPARAALRQSLMRRLARVAAPLLYEELERQCPARPSSRERSTALPDEYAPMSRRIYHEFVRRMLSGGIAALLREHPVLARLMATSATLWCDATVELLRRLAADRDRIAEYFAGGRDPGDLVAAHPDLSDAHGGGRTVCSLTFDCGLRLVYKPRGLGADAAFGELLQWLATHGAPLTTATATAIAPRVLDCGDHGWAEYLEQRDCRDQGAVRRYYQLAGTLLSLLHALGSTDCHYENLVAVGEAPVLIDLETVLQPEVQRAEPPTDRARNIGARRLYDDSVLRTGMLPIWQAAGGDGAYDIGGLSAQPGQATPFTDSRWSCINTDAMRLVHERAVIGEHPNMPLLGGVAAPPAKYVDDIVLGFSRMYEWLGAHTESLLSHDGPIARLARERVRFIARPSSVYDYVLRQSIGPTVLRDGAMRSIALDLLARGLLTLDPALWPLLRAEQLALEDLDIPIFTIRGDGTRVELHRADGADADGIQLARSGLDVARSRFATLCATDLALQTRIIRASFALRYANENPAPAAGESVGGTGHVGGACDACGRAELLDVARGIGAELQQTALTDAEGHVTWITVEPVAASGRCRLQTTGYGLYDGLAGIAVFLAAVARCCDQPTLGVLARRTLLPLRWRLHSAGPTLAEEFGIGGACGSAGAVYALLRAGVLLGDESLIDEAVHAAWQITPATIAADGGYDVLYGSAGAILALLALHQLRPLPGLLEHAVACGSHLLANRWPATNPTGAGGGHHAWCTAGGRMLVGFAHGTAGIAYSLLRLHAATDRTEFRAAAVDALLYEDSLFDEERGVWPDLRIAGHATRASDTAATWCHGAAGIGLARLGALRACDMPDLRRGLERAIAAIRPAVAPAFSSYNLCCGAFGSIELLFSAGLWREEPALTTAALQRASAVIRQQRAAGADYMFAGPDLAVQDPSLYRGMAGIGYGLLRLCHSDLLPSLLLWE